MKAKLKLWARRLLSALRLAAHRTMLRWLRKLVDLADDRLHAAEVRLRNDLSPIGTAKAASHHDPTSVRSVRTTPVPSPRRENFQQWEARRSGVAPVSKKEAHRRRAVSAAAFDLRFAR